MQQHPQWVQRYQAAKPQDRYYGKSWTPLLADAAYAARRPRRPRAGQAGRAQPLPVRLLQRQRQARRRLLQPPEDRSLPRRTDPGLRARRDRRRKPGPQSGRRARHAGREPVGARLREPCLRPGKQDVARPPAAPGPHAGRLLRLPGQTRRHGQCAGGADGRPWLCQRAGIFRNARHLDAQRIDGDKLVDALEPAPGRQPWASTSW